VRAISQCYWLKLTRNLPPSVRIRSCRLARVPHDTRTCGRCGRYFPGLYLVAPDRSTCILLPERCRCTWQATTSILARAQVARRGVVYGSIARRRRRLPRRPRGVILAWKATPSRSWSISSLRLRRVVPGAHWRGQPRRGSRHERDYGKIGRGPWRRGGF
jgi:hypothetical protein